MFFKVYFFDYLAARYYKLFLISCWVQIGGYSQPVQRDRSFFITCGVGIGGFWLCHNKIYQISPNDR